MAPMRLSGAIGGHRGPCMTHIAFQCLVLCIHWVHKEILLKISVHVRFAVKRLNISQDTFNEFSILDDKISNFLMSSIKH